MKLRTRLVYANLPAEPRPGVSLYCPSCRAEFSACRSDYFGRQTERPTCSGCGSKLVLVQIERRIIAG